MTIRAKNALIVEDDLLISLLEKKLLTHLGFHVTKTVTKGRLAVEAVKDHKPDLIIMDICLADDVNGLAAAKEIWKISEVPIVFVSGNIDLYRSDINSQFKGHAFVSKPFSKRILLEAIDRACSPVPYKEHVA